MSKYRLLEIAIAKLLPFKYIFLRNTDKNHIYVLHIFHIYVF